MKKRIFGLCLVLSLLGLLCFSGAAAEMTVYVSSGGNDSANGTSASSAVKSVGQAIHLLDSAGATDGRIVLTDALAPGDSVTEPAHTFPIVLTTNDGKTDYAKSGAKLILPQNKRYILGGDTTFADLTVEYSGTLNFVCGYHAVTFDNGFETVRTDNASSGVYVVGGFQTPDNNAVLDLDTHITVRSGHFAHVIGGSRQRADGSDHNTFTGTHYLTVEGGDILNLYGASVAAQYSKNAVISVSGGHIGTLNVAGDLSRRLNGNATVTLSGGSIDTLNVNNVLGKAEVYLYGAAVKSARVFSANEEVEKLEKKANQPKILYYGSGYTDAELAALGEGFDEVVNNAMLYAAQNGKGSGKTESDPASFADAFAATTVNGGKICLVGNVTMQSFVEPRHTAKISVVGKTADVKLAVASYTLGGETTFADLTLDGGVFSGGDGVFVADKTLKTDRAPEISAADVKLYGGTFGKVGAADELLVQGATVGEIAGGNLVEVLGGKVGVLQTGTAAAFTLTVGGGEVDKVIFGSHAQSLTFSYTDGYVKDFAVAGKSNGARVILGEGYALSMLGAASSLFTVGKIEVCYLKDGGTGSGRTFNDACGSFAEAYALLSDGGTIVICGPYTMSSVFQAPQHSGKMVITSVFGGVDYQKSAGAKLIMSGNYYIGGETLMENLTITTTKNYLSIYANNFPLTLGRGITTEKTSNVTTYPSVMGGSQSVQNGGATNLKIFSGDWQRVRGGTAADGSTDYAVHLTINGGAFHEGLTLGNSGSFGGTIDAVINGGTFYQGIYLSMLSKDTQTFAGDVTLTVNGGIIYSEVAVSNARLGNFEGKYDLILNGGSFAHCTGIYGVQKLSGSMTAAITASFDLAEKVTGDMTFTNPVQTSGADPWLFEHNGYYWYAVTAGNGLTLRKVANIGDLQVATTKKVYTPEAGKPWSSSFWSPEIHYYTDAQIGAGNGGWYCYFAAQAESTNGNNHQMYVIKCLDGDDFFGRWGHPVTGEVNVPAPIEQTAEVGAFAGQSDIVINGKLYVMYVGEEGRGTANKYQTICILPMTNPWTFTGTPTVICVPEYDWEKGGATYKAEGNNLPQVVEGSTAVYGDDGSVYVVYSGSGYWTPYYALGQLKYTGGDPMDAANWQKKPTPILSRNSEVNGCGHASYCTDVDGQRWICYHGYIGADASGSRYAFVEPYTADASGVTIGDGSGHPAPLSKVYTVKRNAKPLSEKIEGFVKVETQTKTSVQLTVGSNIAGLNGNDVTLDAAPINRHSRILLPVRFLANALGVSNDGIHWDGNTSTATLKSGDTEIVIKIGADSMTVGGKRVALDSPAIIENNRTYLPVRAIANALGVSNDNIIWNGETSTAILKK